MPASLGKPETTASACWEGEKTCLEKGREGVTLASSETLAQRPAENGVWGWGLTEYPSSPRRSDAKAHSVPVTLSPGTVSLMVM